MPPVWKPSVTVAAVVERRGRFLLVEERTRNGIRLNQPAGHLDPGESVLDGCARETLEETAHAFTPTHLLGIYMFRHMAAAGAEHVTYLRFAFVGTLGARAPGRALDAGIVRTLWLTPQEIRARIDSHRSPLVMTCVDDYLRGQRYPLQMLYTHPSAAGAAARPADAPAGAARRR